MFRHSRKIAVIFLAAFCGFNTLVIQERAQWWIKAGFVARDILEETEQLSATLGSEEFVYVVNLPRRLNGAYIFLAGYREAIPLIIPDGEKKIRDLGFKDSAELKTYRGFRIYTYDDGAMKEIQEF